MKGIAKKLVAATAAGVLMLGGFAAQASAKEPTPPPGSEVPQGSETPDGYIWRENCTIYVQATLDEVTEYRMEFIDDGEKLKSEFYTPAKANELHTFSLLLNKPVGTELKGLGIHLHKWHYIDFIGSYDWVTVISDTYWDFPDSDKIFAACAASGGQSDGTTPAPTPTPEPKPTPTPEPKPTPTPEPKPTPVEKKEVKKAGLPKTGV